MNHLMIGNNKNLSIELLATSSYQRTRTMLYVDLTYSSTDTLKTNHLLLSGSETHALAALSYDTHLVIHEL